MRKVGQGVVAAALLVLVPVIAALMNSRQAAAQGPPNGMGVQILGPLPVPVTGSLGVTGPVSATVTGTVGLATGASVFVNNPVGNPVRVRDVNDAQQPVQANADCTSAAGTIGCGINLYTVPQGKRLVIEYASVSTCSLPGQIAVMSLLTTVGGSTTSHFVPSTPPAPSPGSNAIGCNGVTPSSISSFGQQLRIYADPSSTIGVEVDRDSNVGNASYTVTMSGYLVDVPFAP